MGSPPLAGSGAGHGRRDVDHALAADLSVPRRCRVEAARADVRPLRGAHALSFSREGALPLGKIGERLQVNAASVTNAVDRLEGHGLVTRRSNPDDGRGTLACLTAAGRRSAAVATDAMNEQVFTDLGVPPTTVRRLFDLLAELRRAAGDFE